MKTNKINSESICHIKSLLKSSYYWMEYRQKSFFYKEGFYDVISLGKNKCRSKQDVEKDKKLVVIDNVIYYKPHLEITTADGKTRCKYFESEKLLNEFIESEQMKKIDWINLV